MIPEGELARYEASECSDLIVTSTTLTGQTTVELPDGTLMNAAGASGCAPDGGANTRSGFYIRKYMNESMDAALVQENRSEQSWIELRYGEVLLNRAEAALELAEAGQGANYREDAFNCINDIRERAGATLLTNSSEMTMDTVRIERRKELGFENKIWWDLKRWRIMTQEQNNTTYRILMPFFARDVQKWFFDVRLDENNRRYTFDSRWYYEDIPSSAITNDGLTQPPGY